MGETAAVLSLNRAGIYESGLDSERTQERRWRLCVRQGGLQMVPSSLKGVEMEGQKPLLDRDGSYGGCNLATVAL